MPRGFIAALAPFFVVTNRPGAEVLPEATYDAYVERGDRENRNKEIKCGMAMDRLSDHRFVANYFRLDWHTLAMNLLTRLRRAIADLPVPSAEAGMPVVATGAAAAATQGTSTDAVGVPVEAWTGERRRRGFRERRRRDPLGEGHPCTWRLLLIKVAAEVVVSARRVVIKLSSSWPHLHWYRQVCERLRLRVLPEAGA